MVGQPYRLVVLQRLVAVVVRYYQLRAVGYLLVGFGRSEELAAVKVFGQPLVYLEERLGLY